jgi:hypothetical protein
LADNSAKFADLRDKYPRFIYHGYELHYDADSVTLRFDFEIDGLADFHPEIVINMGEIPFFMPNSRTADLLAFHIGLIELLSYWKVSCAPIVEIACAPIDENQIQWLKKLYYNGLGEFFYVNNINISMSDFMTIKSTFNADNASNNRSNNALASGISYNGCLIPVGGGKDSCVTLELLPQNADNYCVIVNPKAPALECAHTAGYGNDRIITIKRRICGKLLDLNAEGFLNGHTPFSAVLAFITYFTAVLTRRKYVVLSNESSANEANVAGTKINHQYSKSYEFERDFVSYAKRVFGDGQPYYFSFLRPLNELQIAMIFSKFPQYHNVFRSCNAGSKGEKWEWCRNCPKCLFVFLILSPFLPRERMIEIFGGDLLAEAENPNSPLFSTLQELQGRGTAKPFECVGTFDEVNWALSDEKSRDYSVLKQYDEQNGLPPEFSAILHDFIGEQNNYD